MRRRLLRLVVPCSALAFATQAGPATASKYDYNTGAATAWAQNYTGQGQTIAVLDTGLIRDRWFDGRAVDEVCMSWEIPPALKTACPNGDIAEFGAGAAQPPLRRAPDVAAKLSWLHGTHVAGAAAGAQSRRYGFAQQRRGIAPDAGLLPVLAANIQADGFSGLNVGDNLGPIVDYVLAKRDEYKIAAVNMSFNAPERFYDDKCDNDPKLGARKYEAEDINKLIDAGISVVVAAGNHGTGPDRYKLRFPACLSRVITVGGLEGDTLDMFPDSSVSPGVDVLAPASELTLPTLISGFLPAVAPGRAGTSYATPMVSAAIAMYKQKNPEATPEEIKRRLMSTGPLVTLDETIPVAKRVRRRALRVDRLLALRTPVTTRKVNRSCFELGFVPAHPDRPAARRGFVRLTCKPSSVAPDRLAVTIDGPRTDSVPTKEVAGADIPFREQPYYGDELVEFGPKVNVITAPDQSYRLCWLYYASADRLWPEATGCKEFET